MLLTLLFKQLLFYSSWYCINLNLIQHTHTHIYIYIYIYTYISLFNSHWQRYKSSILQSPILLAENGSAILVLQKSGLQCTKYFIFSNLYSPPPHLMEKGHYCVSVTTNHPPPPQCSSNGVTVFFQASTGELPRTFCKGLSTLIPTEKAVCIYIYIINLNLTEHTHKYIYISEQGKYYTKEFTQFTFKYVEVFIYLKQFECTACSPSFFFCKTVIYISFVFRWPPHG